MTTPRTVGRLPFQRMRPALPQLMLDCSALPTSPIVARQRTSTKRISPEGMRSVAREPSLATSWARVAGRAGDLGAAAGTQLDAVDRRTDRDVAQRQVVARLDVGGRAGLDRGALAQVLRRDDVALLAVGVVQQRDPGGAVRVVLDVRDLGRHAVLVVATEVDDAVGALVATTLVTGGDPALVVAAALLGQRTRSATSPAWSG